LIDNSLKGKMKKKLLVRLVTGVLVLGMAGMAQALTMDDVGEVDKLIAETNLGNSGEATELTWVNDTLFALKLGDGHDFVFKDEMDENASEWQTIIDGESVFAYETEDEPAYFLIKTGKNSGSINTHFLFDNLNSIDWAVISLLAMGFSDSNILNISKVSHIDGFDGDGNQPVPEPATVLLVGTGLAGLAAVRRRKAKKN
jgi:hypothetical protein